MKSLLDQRRRE